MLIQQRIHALNKRVYQCEKHLAGAVLLAMVAVTFIDVLHRVLSRVPGRAASMLHPLLQQWGVHVSLDALDTWLPWGAGVLVCYAGLNAARKTSINTHRMLAMCAACALMMVLYVWVRAMPEGYVWAPYAALCGLLWAGMLGASMAMFHGKHLALEMGDSLWPNRIKPYVHKVRHTTVAVFCAVIACVGCISVKEHYLTWLHVQGADTIPSLNIPKWCVFAVIPYAFAMMSLRAMGMALGVLKAVEEESEVVS